jgi:hypothetical protein
MKKLLAAAFAVALAPSVVLAGVDCPGDPGLALSIDPQQVVVGTGFDVTVVAPTGSLILLVMSGTPGPTPTPYGSLCVGAPFQIFPFVQPAPQITFPHPLQCRGDYVGIKGYFQFFAANLAGPVPQIGMSNSTSLEIIDGFCTSTPATGSLVSFTQGGWGTNCSGGNPGCIRDANFATVFPNGLILGDADGVDGDSAFAIHLTSSAAVAAYIPAGGPSKPLTKNHTNPTSTEAGVFGGQLTAAKLNVGFDAAGVFDTMKSDPSLKLADLVFAKNVHPKLIGKSVAEVIVFADLAISGAVALPLDVDGDTIGDVSASDISNALDKLNNAFVDGTTSTGDVGLAHFPAP